jgi:transcriptional regulator with XRE-family HTH domain
VKKSAFTKLGDAIRNRRNGLKISQEQLAEMAGLDRSYISLLERNLRSPTIATLELICTELNCIPETILAEARKL